MPTTTPFKLCVTIAVFFRQIYISKSKNQKQTKKGNTWRNRGARGDRRGLVVEKGN
jgi:hypothetical protein